MTYQKKSHFSDFHFTFWTPKMREYLTADTPFLTEKFPATRLAEIQPKLTLLYLTLRMRGEKVYA